MYMRRMKYSSLRSQSTYINKKVVKNNNELTLGYYFAVYSRRLRFACLHMLLVKRGFFKPATKAMQKRKRWRYVESLVSEVLLSSRSAVSKLSFRPW